jgi:hypothetical protein
MQPREFIPTRVVGTDSDEEHRHERTFSDEEDIIDSISNDYSVTKDRLQTRQGMSHVIYACN